VAKYVRISPYKVRQVLDLVRGYPADRAAEILKFCERDAATVVGKLLASAVANAEHDHAMIADELFVSACYADEGPTLKRWRPRARGRATRIRKRTCHVTLLVSRLPDRELQNRRARQAQGVVGDRSRRRRGGAAAEPSEPRGRPTRRRPEDRGGPPAVVEPDEATVEELLTEPEVEVTAEAPTTEPDTTETRTPAAPTPEAAADEAQSTDPEEEST
jgi:large subunit ribosomal protein L22